MKARHGVDYYGGQIRKRIEAMRARLVAGEGVNEVAMSVQDFSKRAYEDNELHFFHPAWRVFQGELLKVRVIGANGREYEKFVPVPLEHETWLPEGVGEVCVAEELDEDEYGASS
jgi:hypothetical protein